MKWALASIQYLAVSVILIGVTALVGHLGGQEMLYTWAKLHNVGMSRPTAASTILIGIALIILEKAIHQRPVHRKRARTDRAPDNRGRARRGRAGKGRAVR